jgi:hypothetical protein
MSSNISAILSAQEQAIESGNKVLHGTATDRVLRMFEAIRAGGQPRLALLKPQKVSRLTCAGQGRLNISQKIFPSPSSTMN